MKNKKHILCFGDSNTWGYCAQTNGRYADNERWTQVLQKLLGSDWILIEEGLCGRTTVFEDPLNEGLSGLAQLQPVLYSHAPLDILMIMLGTNDCKERFSATPKNISDGMDRLIKKAKTLSVWRTKPNILISAPIIIDECCYTSSVAGEMGARCVEKSKELPSLLQQCASDNRCAYFDCNPYVKANTIDGMHFDFPSNKSFAHALYPVVTKLLA